MAKILEMPKLSPTMEEGVLSAWHKNEGDSVAVDDLLAEVETDKATMEFRAFDKTTLLKILVQAGAQVQLGQPVAVIGEAGEDITELLAQIGKGAGKTERAPASQPAADDKGNEAADGEQADAAPAPAKSGDEGTTATNAPAPPAAASAAKADATKATPPPAQAEDASAGPSSQLAPDTDAPQAQRKPPVVNVLDRTSYGGQKAPAEGGGTGGAGDGRVLASPYVRKVAREMGVDLHGARGTGPGGRVLPGDVEGLREPAKTSAAMTRSRSETATPAVRPTIPAPARGPDDSEARPLSPMRKTIARRLTESKTTVPHFYLSIDVDAGELVKLRAAINAELASGEGGEAGAPTKVSLNDLIVKACAIALVRVPECNASFTPEAILVHRRVDISVAVAIPDGLVTPVVRGADQKSVATIARELRELAGRARARKLKPEEMADGTFSISNLGMFGIDDFAAVINPPEGAILAVGQVRHVPVVVGDAVVPGQRLAMTLSCDHRVVDGAIGAAFLAELRRLIEHPLRVLAG